MARVPLPQPTPLAGPRQDAAIRGPRQRQRPPQARRGDMRRYRRARFEKRKLPAQVAKADRRSFERSRHRHGARGKMEAATVANVFRRIA